MNDLRPRYPGDYIVIAIIVLGFALMTAVMAFGPCLIASPHECLWP